MRRNGKGKAGLVRVQKYETAKAAIEEIEGGGATVRFSVDAMRITQCLAVGERRCCCGKQ